MGTILEISRKKSISYRAEVRRKDTSLCKTFQRKTDAQRWINSRGDHLQGWSSHHGG